MAITGTIDIKSGDQVNPTMPADKIVSGYASQSPRKQWMLAKPTVAADGSIIASKMMVVWDQGETGYAVKAEYPTGTPFLPDRPQMARDSLRVAPMLIVFSYIQQEYRLQEWRWLADIADWNNSITTWAPWSVHSAGVAACGIGTHLVKGIAPAPPEWTLTSLTANPTLAEWQTFYGQLVTIGGGTPRVVYTVGPWSYGSWGRWKIEPGISQFESWLTTQGVPWEWKRTDGMGRPWLDDAAYFYRVNNSGL